MTYFLGVDAGGSHCRARLTDASGTVIGSGLAGPANARMGVEPLFNVLMEACDGAIAEAGLAKPDAAAIHGMGIAGLSRTGVQESLEALPFPFASTVLETDAAIANIGAHDGADGATLILGTGSVAIVAIAGHTFTIGGYGFPISDEGSGAALGLSAMRHALRSLDGRSQRTPFAIAVTQRFEHNPSRAIAWMDQAAPRDYASFAPLVMDLAEADDPVARSIVEDAATHIERFIETIFQRGAPRCALAGGLAPRIQPWLRARTAARLSPALGDALDGALLLAGLRRQADL